MRALLAATLFALAAAAAAQSATPAPAPTPAQVPERPAINLKLDEPAAPRPKINFGPANPGIERSTGSAAGGLPSLGQTPGSRGPIGDIPVRAPYPIDAQAPLR